MAGEYMLLDTAANTVDLNSVFRINEPVAWLWERIGRQEFSEKLLVDWICGEYDVDRDIAEQDVSNMVNLWKKYGMII